MGVVRETAFASSAIRAFYVENTNIHNALGLVRTSDSYVQIPVPHEPSWIVATPRPVLIP